MCLNHTGRKESRKLLFALASASACLWAWVDELKIHLKQQVKNSVMTARVSSSNQCRVHPPRVHECMCACHCVCMCLCVGGGRVRGHISLPSTFRIDFFTDTRLRDKSLVQHGCPHALTHYSSPACAHRSSCRSVYTLSKARSKWSSIIHTDKRLKIYSLL